MKITDFLVENRIVFGLKSKNKEEVLKEMAELFLTSNDIIKEGMFDTFVEDLI